MSEKNYGETIPIHKWPVLPDRELQKWEKWIQIRNDEAISLGKRLHKPPADLAMNLLDKVRHDKERKLALEHAQIERKTGVRGSLWDRPPKLKQRCYCAPAYELHRTAAEKGRPRIVEHVGVPEYIQQTEMGIIGESVRNPCTHLNAEYEMYRDYREGQLTEKLKKIDPFRPDIDNLIVRGRTPSPPPKKYPVLPEIAITDDDEPPGEPLKAVFALKINNTVLYRPVSGHGLFHVPTFQEDENHETCTNWSYYFNVPAKRAGRCKLTMENLGTITLRYCWKKMKRNIPFVPEDATEQVFFFNKNEDVISPGQVKEIAFTFIADRAGIYSEFWELSMCNTHFFEKLFINLYADATEDVDAIDNRVQNLKTEINNKAILNLVTAFLEKAFDNVFEPAPQFEPYPYDKYFVESELFILRNPMCYYHQTEVGKMKELYTEMLPDKEWDLSIATWREVMMAKDYEERMKYYELLRLSHAVCLKPWTEGDSLVEEKFRTIQCLFGQFLDLFDREFTRITDSFVFKPPETRASALRRPKSRTIAIDPITAQMLRNVFYLRMYEHFSCFIELCAGVLSSLDLNRWIEFDFCRHLD
ncbi:MYCBP-associated protein-like [Spodoptera frugiperda]|uniref:MYCBP-associated protein-like n=1 Tax=Spodoptera frugiperda TaxID=7108 RepID=A0A9R0D379_SPOFR|nr:MYCBP-associated protein-like [Spodoptera frugiperda]